MALDLPHTPIVLYRASFERRDAAWSALARNDYVLAVYLGGLAVECLLQAAALLDDPTRDARHNLSMWLLRCRVSMQDALQSDTARPHWARLNRVWQNGLRYLSSEGFLGYLRQRELARNISGGPHAIMRRVAKDFLESVEFIHGQGVAQWERFKRS